MTNIDLFSVHERLPELTNPVFSVGDSEEIIKNYFKNSSIFVSISALQLNVDLTHGL